MTPLWMLSSSALIVLIHADAGAEQTSPPESKAVPIRLNRPLPAEQFKKVAALGESRILDKYSHPDLKLLSLRTVSKVLCGSFRPSYWELLKERNPGMLERFAPDRALGEIAYSIKWPACIYVSVKPVEYTVKKGDNTASIYKSMTGLPGSKEGMTRFFKASGVTDLSKIYPGTKLVGAHSTATTMLKLSVNADAINATLTVPRNQTISGVAESALAALPESNNPPSGPEFEITAGKTESAGSSGYEDPAECNSGSEAGLMFDAVSLRHAYNDSLVGMRSLGFKQNEAKVAIADNGFFGAKVTNGQVIFGSTFPERFFPVSSTLPDDGMIGPVVIDGTLRVYPLNSMNNLGQADVVSGHGTHVAGLVLGGAAFQSQLSIFDRTGADESWLSFWIINVGNGKKSLIPGSVAALSLKLNTLSDYIINLSIQYPPSVDEASRELNLRDDQDTNNLFVVAAGNGNKPDVRDAPYYPAVLGGTAQSNVITVAAHRGDGTLASFSNRGKASVDLAAPGCRLPSWLDDTGNVVSVSGTSQAAAVVTFAAALLKSLGGLKPLHIKNRLMISGDILVPQPAGSDVQPDPNVTLPDPSEVLSRARLNIVRSLFLFDDYVKYRAANGEIHEVLGEVQGITPIKTTACNKPLNFKSIWSIKKAGGTFLVYKGRNAPYSVAQEPCVATPDNGAIIKIKVRASLAKDGKPMLAGGEVLEVPFDALDQYVAASKPYRKPVPALPAGNLGQLPDSFWPALVSNSK